MAIVTTSSGQTATTEPPEPVMLTPREVSTRIKVPLGTLQQWRHNGRGPKWFKLEERHIRYWESDFEAWLAAQQTQNE